MPMKLCNEAGCKQLVDYRVKYCDEHKKEERTRSKADSYENRKAKGGKYFWFYKSKQWQNATKLYRINNPCCEMCLKNGVIKKADVCDHIVEIRTEAGWKRRLDETNYMSLCHACHNEKTKREKLKRLQDTQR